MTFLASVVAFLIPLISFALGVWYGTYRSASRLIDALYQEPGSERITFYLHAAGWTRMRIACQCRECRKPQLTSATNN